MIKQALDCLVLASLLITLSMQVMQVIVGPFNFLGSHVLVMSGHVRVMSRSCQGHVRIMSGSGQGHGSIMSGSGQGHVRIMSGSRQGHVRFFLYGPLCTSDIILQAKKLGFKCKNKRCKCKLNSKIKVVLLKISSQHIQQILTY
jgi:hypothetical protein